MNLENLKMECKCNIFKFFIYKLYIPNRMKIYTKTGDEGKTSLNGGTRVFKDDENICAIGDIDELNCYLGVIGSMLGNSILRGLIPGIQRRLFDIGAELATPDEEKKQKLKRRINPEDIIKLELQIDVWQEELPKLTNFILPGGCPIGTQIHLARAVCRRAERSIQSVSLKYPEINPDIRKYINRLSDYLFVMARIVNFRTNTEEIIWKQ